MYRYLVLITILITAIDLFVFSDDNVEKSVQSQPLSASDVLTTQTTPTTPTIPKPDYLKVVVDPATGTTVTRVADQTQFASNLLELRHRYAKNQPWNADESYLLLDFKYPAALLNGRTYKFMRWVKQPAEGVWSNLNPSLMYGILNNTNQFIKLDVSQGKTYQVVRKFEEYDQIDFGGWNGNLSQNDRYAAFVGLKGEKLDLLVYDLQLDRVISRKTQPKGTTMRNYTQSQIDRIDSFSMAVSGKYVIVGYPQSGQGQRRGVHLLDRSLKFIRQLSQRGGSHFDSCVNSRGSEAIVVEDDRSSALVAVEYKTGKKTTLLSADKLHYNLHVSCRNLNRPGWAYISEFAVEPDPTADPTTAKRNTDRTFALKLDGSGTIEQFTPPHHSASTAYERQPHSVPNRNGMKVLFASDWGNSVGPVYAYVTSRNSKQR
jgi:hypothetical protein